MKHIKLFDEYLNEKYNASKLYRDIKKKFTSLNINLDGSGIIDIEAELNNLHIIPDNTRMLDSIEIEISANGNAEWWIFDDGNEIANDTNTITSISDFLNMIRDMSDVVN